MRCAKFVARKNCIIIGTDDNHVRAYNYNTLERIADFEAHSDYIRSIAIHPTKPLFLTSSDDCTVKLWDWESNFKLMMTFEGHQHYVMQVVFNPKDPNQFATASLDRSVKIWSLGSAHCMYTLDVGGHEKGVNSVAFYHGGDRPYLATSSDDHTIKIWDYQSKSSIRTLQGHSQNVSSIVFHPRLPVLLSASEDGTVRVWGTSTFRCELVMTIGLDRLWSIGCSERGTTGGEIGIAGDLGWSVMVLGKQEAPVSIDPVNGKLIWATHSTISQCRLQDLVESSCKLERGKGVSGTKELGECEFVATQLHFSPNGRFICVQGDAEWCVYTAVAWRNRSFGKAVEFVWAGQQVGNNVFAVRESQDTIRVFEDFQEIALIKTVVPIEHLYGGGPVLAVSGNGYCVFYEYRSGTLLQAIEQEDVNSVLFNNDATADEWMAALGLSGDQKGLFIINSHFDILYKNDQDKLVKGGVWINHEAFVYSTSEGKISYWLSAGAAPPQLLYSNSDSHAVSLLGHTDNRLYLLSASDMTIRYINLPMALINYQTAIISGNHSHADKLLSELKQCDDFQSVLGNKVAKFLDSQDQTAKAAEIATDPQLLFNYSLKLGQLERCISLLSTGDKQRWRQLGEAALSHGKNALAADCMAKAGRSGDALLIAGIEDDVKTLEYLTAGDFNVAFSAAYLCKSFGKCFDLLMKTKRYPEAAMFAQSHRLPAEKITEAVTMWRQGSAARLADPVNHPHLFTTVTQPTAVTSTITTNSTTSNSQYKTRKGSIKSTTSYDDDLLSVEVNTTGTGSMRTDDVDEAMAAAVVSASLPTIHDTDGEEDVVGGLAPVDSVMCAMMDDLSVDPDTLTAHDDTVHDTDKPHDSLEGSMKDAMSSELDDLEDGW